MYLRWFLVPLFVLAGIGCAQSLQQSSAERKQNQVIRTFRQVERRVTVGVDPSQYPAMVVEVKEALADLPSETPPRVTQLLQESVVAYLLAYRYWQCEQMPPGAEQAACRDRQIEKVVARFPHIKRNFINRLTIRPNPPAYLSHSITTTNMLRLLLMQAALNRVDAHLILTNGDFEPVYSAQI